MTRARMSDGITFLIYGSYRDFCDAWAEALKQSRVIEVVNARGLRRIVNPRQIIYVEEL